MKILFVMDKRVDAGSIHAIANYVRAGDEAGHTIALYGRSDSRYPKVRFSVDAGAFDYVVFVMESGLNWLSALRLPRILSQVPYERRAIIDADGMYNRIIQLDGYDRNHPNEQQRAQWLEYYSILAGRVFQPTWLPRERSVGALPFYGYDPSALIGRNGSDEKAYDLLCVGHNWWRWREVSTRLLPAIERARENIGNICFMGTWWDEPPVVDHTLAVAFESDPKWFERLAIRIEPAVPYTDVVRAMNRGRLNIMLQRPLLRELKLLTSKYFEIFTADTIPMVMLDPDHAEMVYGPAGRELALFHDIEHKLVDALRHPGKYARIVQAVRDHLMEHHSYPVRIRQLVKSLQAESGICTAKERELLCG
jgi:glycosyl transferase family 1